MRIGGVFLDETTGNYKVFFLNLPRVALDSGSPDVEEGPYVQTFQIPPGWPTGRYQFAICAPGYTIADGHVGLQFDIYSPSLDGAGSAPPGTGGPVTDAWVFVEDGANFPGNHPDYAQLASDGVTGVLWLDSDPTSALGIASTRAAGLQAGVWSVAGNSQTAASFAAQCSAAVVAYAPDILVADAEVVAEGFNPSLGWTWCADFVTDYRALQPTQVSAVTTPPLLGFPAPYNYGAFTAAGFAIWPQSYGASIPADDIDPIQTRDSVIANGVSPDDVKVVIPGDPWGADVTELKANGIYTFAVFDAEIMLASGGGPAPTPPPPGINGLAGVPSGYAFYPRPRIAPGYPQPRHDGFGNIIGTGEDVAFEWDEWQFTLPLPNGTTTIGPLPNSGGSRFLTPGIYQQGFWWQDCHTRSNPGAFPDGYFFEGSIGSVLFVDEPDATCGQHYFALVMTDFVVVPDREWLDGSQWKVQLGFHVKFAHSSAAAFFKSDCVSPPRPIDELRGGVIRYDIRPYSGYFDVPGLDPHFGTRPYCGSNLSAPLGSGPHAGSYAWQIVVFGFNGENLNSSDECSYAEGRIVNAPVGGVPGDAATWTDTFQRVPDWPYGSAGDTLYLPSARCWTFEWRTVCDGVRGSAVSCSVCTPGLANPVLDIELRAEG